MKIFVSYSSKTKAIVAELADDLIASGYTVWFDRELTGGRQWWADILQQIRECDLFLFALTQQALESLPCRREFGYADALGKRILPVQMNEINITILPTQLQKIHFVDYRLRDKKQLAALNKALNNLPPPYPILAVEEPPPPLSPLADLRGRIDSLNLTVDAQKALVYDLNAAYRDPETKATARALAELLLKREDELNVSIYRDLWALLITSWKSYVLQHKPKLNAVAFSSDNRWVLTAGNDPTIRMWDTIDGREVQRFKGHQAPVTSIVFSHNNHVILSGSMDKSVRQWQVSSGAEIQKIIAHDNNVNSVAFSPDGHSLLSCSNDVLNDYTIQLWEANTGFETQHFKVRENHVGNVIFSPDSQAILIGTGDIISDGENLIRILDINSREEIQRFIGHKAVITSVGFSLDGHFVLSGSFDQTMRLWDVISGNEIQQFTGHTNWVNSVAFSPDGHHVISGSADKTIRLWQISNGDEIHKFIGHKGSVNSVAFSPDGRAILSGSADGTARIWPLNDIF